MLRRGRGKKWSVLSRKSGRAGHGRAFLVGQRIFEPWDDHRRGRDEVRLYYKELLSAAADFQIVVHNRYIAEMR